MRIKFVGVSSPDSDVEMKFVHLPAGFGCDQFWMSVTPVTEAQWADVMGGKPTTSRKPKLEVNFEDAQAFCEKLGPKYRLPTEFEWCRAVGVEPTNLADYAVFGGQDNCPDVATKLPNEYGLYDMRGLCWEWLEGDGTEIKWLRGGSWSNLSNYCRSAYRNLNELVVRYGNIGFRVVVVAPHQENK